MIRVELAGFIFALGRVKDYENHFSDAWLKNPDSKLTQDELDEVAGALSGLDAGLESIGLTSCQYDLSLISLWLRQPKLCKIPLPSCELLFHQLRDLHTKIQDEASKHGFVYIAEEQTALLENDSLFGTDVNSAFPSMRQDIKDAGNCLAADLSTAAVFHLMRVAESGMRTLAKHLGVRIEKKKGVKLCSQCNAPVGVTAVKPKTKLIPLEYAMWDDVLKALEVRVKKFQTPKGRERDKQYQFYHGLVLSLNAFKDIWRNPVSHCRRMFDVHEAKHAYVHVKALMETLATKLKERP